MALGIKPLVDFVFKRVFGSAEHTLPLLALLQAILAPDQRIVQVEIRTPQSSIKRVVSHGDTETRRCMKTTSVLPLWIVRFICTKISGRDCSKQCMR